MENFYSDYRIRKIRRECCSRWMKRLLWALAIFSLMGFACVSNASVEVDIATELEKTDQDTKQVDLFPWEQPPVMVCHWFPGAQELLVIVNGEPELVSILSR